MKRCTKCGTEKEEDCFGKDSKAKDGKFYWCRECVKKHSKAYYHDNAEKCRESSLSIYHRNHQDEDFRERRNARQRVFSKDYVKRPESRILAREAHRRYVSKTEARISRRLSFQVWYTLRLVLDKSKKKNGRHWQDLVGGELVTSDDIDCRFEI